MARNARKQKFILEEMKITIHRTVGDFLNSLDEYMEFPPTLTKDERAYIHEYIRPMGLMSRSHGSGKKRRLMLYKRVHKTSLTQWIALTPESRRYLGKYLTADIPIQIETPTKNRDSKKCRNGLLTLPNVSKKLIPQKGNGPRYIAQERAELPIVFHKDTILDAIEANRVNLWNLFIFLFIYFVFVWSHSFSTVEISSAWKNVNKSISTGFMRISDNLLILCGARMFLFFPFRIRQNYAAVCVKYFRKCAKRQPM